MTILAVFLFVIWFFVLLYGLVYLLVDSDLLERPRNWFTSTVQSPEDAAITALLAESTAERSLPQVKPQAEKAFMPPPPLGGTLPTPFIPPPSSPAPQAATAAKMPPPAPTEKMPPDVQFVPPPAAPGWLRVFVGKVLSCWQCTSGWVALPAAGLVALFALALHHEAYWAVVILSVFMVPPTGIGFTTMMDHLSPKRASESVVNAMTDIAQAVLDAKSEKPSKPVKKV